MSTRLRYTLIEAVDRLSHALAACTRTCAAVLEYLTRVESDPHREARERLTEQRSA